jgi:serine phosphatase RsbU (regulator of sigma subunit)
MAAQVQRSLLPRAPRSLPGLEVAGRMIPCDAVGGDYLDFLTGGEFAGRGFGVAVGDVAGHGPAAALLVDPGTRTVAGLEGDGPFLGLDAGITFREHHAPFREPGQVVALCTDGITETWNERGEQFGRERLKQSLLRHASQPATSILEGDGAPGRRGTS